MSLIISGVGARPDCAFKGCREQGDFKVWIVGHEERAEWFCGHDVDNGVRAMLKMGQAMYKSEARVRSQDMRIEAAPLPEAQFLEEIKKQCQGCALPLKNCVCEPEKMNELAKKWADRVKKHFKV